MGGNTETEAIAKKLQAAFEEQDLSILAGILAPDVRWGGEEETPQTCHNRADVLAWYGGLNARGVRASVLEAAVGPDRIVLTLDVMWPGGEATRNYQRFTVRDGAIVDIRDNESPPIDP